jgi:hypothetical protein
MIKYEKAQQLSVDAALNLFGSYVSADLANFDFLFSKPIISSSYCWIFIRNPAIEIPESDWFAKGSAIAVSFSGEVRQIADHNGDTVLLKDYAEKLSLHFMSNTNPSF